MRVCWGLVWSSVLPLILACGTAAAVEPQIGVVVQREFNGAIGTRTSAASDEDLPYTHEVFAGERVNTPDKASTVMRFRDQTQLQVGANSSVVLDRFIYDPDAQAMSGSITLAKGIFRYVSRSAINDQGVKLTTATTTLSIRGTTFVVYVAGDGSTTVVVLKGLVDVKPCGGGAAPRIGAGSGVKVSPSCAMTEALLSMPDDPAVQSDYDVDIEHPTAKADHNASNPASGHEPASPDHEPDGPGQ